MHPLLLAALPLAATALGMSALGLVAAAVGGFAASRSIGTARGADRVLALAGFCYAVPLAVFGALHLFGPRFVANLVPPYMPVRALWVPLVGVALVAASLSIATGVAARWSGFLVGVTMFLFVAMIHLPGAIRMGHDRVLWTIVFRESSFGGGAWILAGTAGEASRGGVGANGGGGGGGWRRMVLVGQVLVTAAILVFGVEHFIWATGLPGVPLKKELPEWLPARAVIDYITGAAMLAAGGCVVVRRNARTALTVLGGWLLVMMVVIYVPVLVAGLSSPEIGAELTGINYFADTLLLTGAVLWLARSLPRTGDPDAPGRATSSTRPTGP